MTESKAHSIGSYRRVAAAVDAVCAVAADFDATDLDEVVLAISAERRRPIEIASAQLGPGVCGQRRSYPDRDVIVLAQASMARVVDTLSPEDKRVPILASPAIAVDYLATVLK